MSQKTKAIKIMIPQTYKPDAEKAMKFIEKLEQSKQGRFFDFVRGMEFAMSLQEKRTIA